MNPILDLLSGHRSIRKFLNTPVDAVLLRSLVSAAQCTSTSHHVQACTIIQACYEKRAPRLKDRTWTSQMADFTGQVIRPHMKSFLEKKGFFKK